MLFGVVALGGVIFMIHRDRSNRRGANVAMGEVEIQGYEMGNVGGGGEGTFKAGIV